MHPPPPVFEVRTPWGPHLAIMQLVTLRGHGMVQADRGKLKSNQKSETKELKKGVPSVEAAAYRLMGGAETC